jgi:solute carrier family 35 (UDP-galactose transporter), member B1
MARSKQPAVKRESSSEYFNKRTASWEGSQTADSLPQTNGVVAHGPAEERSPQAEESSGGALQLVVAVAGIYASL